MESCGAEKYGDLVMLNFTILYTTGTGTSLQH